MRVTCPFRQAILLTALTMTTWMATSLTVYGQRTGHPLLRSSMPPGMVGQLQVARGVSRPGYVQPVRVDVPDESIISIAGDTGYQMDSTSLLAGLLLGHVYRLKVTNIPGQEDLSLYPSVEVIDRLHPPEGQRNRFPIPIQITRQDLEAAAAGKMVVRVIYLENPAEAFPKAETSDQLSIDVLTSEDPLQVADDRGRPMAILRIGSRIPTGDDHDAHFVFGAPPVEWITDVPSQPFEPTVDEDAGLSPVVTPNDLQSPSTGAPVVDGPSTRNRVDTDSPSRESPIQPDDPFRDDATR